MSESQLSPHRFCSSPEHQTDPVDCGPCNDLRFLEDEIPRIRNLLDSYLAKQRLLRLGFNEVHSPPIRLLPDEVLGQVFERCMLVKPDDEVGTRTTLYLPQIQLVCRRWREVAINTSSLWCTVCIDLSIDKITAPRDEMLLKQWLNRSLNRPIDVSVNYKNTASADDSDSFKARVLEILNLLNEHSYRWKSLQAYLPPRYMSHFRGPQAMQPPSYEEPPILEFISLRSTSIDRTQRSTLKLHPYFDLGSHFPSLSHVLLQGLHLRSTSIDWTNVTHLDVDNIYLDELLEIFRQAQRLVICEARVYEGQSDMFYVPQESIVLPSLKTLKCLLKVHAQLAPRNKFFNKLTLPSLTVLDVDCANLPLYIVELCNFIDRSNCILTDLTLRRGDVEVGRLIRLLKKTPMLESLRLICSKEEGIYLTEEFIDLFSATSVFDKDSTGQFLPNLRHLNHEGPTCWPWDRLPDLILPNDYSDMASGILPPSSSAPRPKRSRRPLHDIVFSFPSEHGIMPLPAAPLRAASDLGIYVLLQDDTRSLIYFESDIERNYQPTPDTFTYL